MPLKQGSQQNHHQTGQPQNNKGPAQVQQTPQNQQNQSKPPIGTIPLSDIIGNKGGRKEQPGQNIPAGNSQIQQNQPAGLPPMQNVQVQKNASFVSSQQQPLPLQFPGENINPDNNIDFDNLGSDAGTVDPMSFLNPDQGHNVNPNVNTNVNTNVNPNFNQQVNQQNIPNLQQPQYQASQQQNQPYIPQPQDSYPQLPSMPQAGETQLSTQSAPPPTGFVEADFGTEISRFPIERIHVSMGVIQRVGIISRKIMIVKFHYEEKIGSFYCWQGLCCQRTGVPQLRYVIPVVQYDTDRDGNVLSGNFEIRYLQLSDKQYRAQKALDRNVPFEQNDYLVICQQEQFQNYILNNCGSAIWLNPQNKQFHDAVLAKFESLKGHIPTAIAQSFSEQEYLQRIARASQFNNPQVPMPGYGQQGPLNINSFIR